MDNDVGDGHDDRVQILDEANVRIQLFSRLLWVNGKIVGQARLFNLGMATGLREGKLLI